MPATSAWSFSVYQLPALLGLGITLLPLAYGIQRRRAPGAKWFLGLLGTVALWCLFDLVSVGGRDRDLVMTATRLLYVPAALLPVCFFMFAQRYANRRDWGRRGGLAALLVIPALTTLLTWTNERHFLLWREFELRDAGPVFVAMIERGPWFWIHVLYSYGLLLSGAAVLLWHLAQSQRVYRAQIAAVASLPLLAAVPNIAYLSGAEWLPPIDPTPPAFAVGSALTWLAFFRYRLLDLVPVARHAVIESMADAVLAIDAHGRIVDANPAAETLLGDRIRPVLGASLEERFPELEREARESIDLGQLAPGRVFELSVTALDAAGQPGRLLVLHDITERRRVETALIETGESLRRANRELEQLASRDALTGLPNRRVFMERLDEELKRFRRQGQPLALALVDLDRFKLVNDNHGHLTGDRVLVETAAVLQSSVREIDLAGRLGGDEFGLLMPGTDLAGARQVAERVRWHLASPAEHLEGKPAPRVTASIGLTVMHPTDPEQTLESLLARADALLYRAKREGRDRVCAD